MATIRTRRLGLAAFMKMNECAIVNVYEGMFTFESDKTLQEWELLYTNSCCSRHDSEVCELRKFLTPKQTIRGN